MRSLHLQAVFKSTAFFYIRVVLLPAILLCTAFAAKAQESPLKVASMNLCTDQFLLLLAQKKNIVALSELAADSQYSYLWQQADGIPLIPGDAEQLLPLKPDLIFAGRYDDSNKVNLLRAFGFQVEIVPLVENLSQVNETLHHMATLIGEPDRGLALTQSLDLRKKQVQERVLAMPENAVKPQAVIYAANGFTHAEGTIHDELLQLAGFSNGASAIGLKGHGNLSLEQLLKIQPQLLIMEDSSDNKNSNAQRFLQHPALKRGLPNTEVVHIPATLWMCGGPASIDVLERLLLIRQQILNNHAGPATGAIFQ